jgi:hypothetical protein
VPFYSIEEAEERLKNRQQLTEEEVFDLIPWMQMLGAGSQARLQAHLGIGNVRAIQALNETSAKIEGAVRRMDDGSAKLGTEGLRLNRSLFVWTIVGILVSTILGGGAFLIALKSYKAADASSVQQQQTLDASRHSLDSTVQTLNRLTAITERQAERLEGYEKQALAKPNLAFDFLFLEPTAKTLKKFKLHSILEYEVPYGRTVILIPIVKNITQIPAHNVRILIGVGVSEKVDNITFAPPQLFREVASSVPGYRMFQRDESALYPGDWQQGQLMLDIKPDAPDGWPQMFIAVDGSDLPRQYQQWLVFRKRMMPEDKK